MPKRPGNGKEAEGIDTLNASIGRHIARFDHLPRKRQAALLQTIDLYLQGAKA